MDTLFVRENTKLLAENQTKYTRRFGIFIQGEYLVEDSLGFKNISREVLDTFFVLTPEGLIAGQDDSSSANRRLLVHIMYSNSCAKLIAAYPNLISDSGELLSSFKGLYKTKNGFNIVHEFGNRYGYKYTTEYGFNDFGRIFISGIEKVCYYDTLARFVEYSYSNYPVSDVSILDSLSKNCNCDPLWNEMEAAQPPR